MFGKQIVISDPLLYRRLLLRQLKNNQNQTNTTGKSAGEGEGWFEGDST
jgi:hypothetical protein